MSAFSTLLALINAQIKTNGLKAITGAKLNGVLVQMVNELGSGYQFIDIATPATDPGTPDENVWYIASQAGTYTNFGGIIVNENEVCALVWNGSWTKKVTGAATAAQVSQLGQEMEKAIRYEGNFETLVEIGEAGATAGAIDTSGNVITASSFRYTGPVYFEVGGTIRVNYSGAGISVVSATDAEGTSYTPIFVDSGVDASTPKEAFVSIPDKTYIAFCYYINTPFSVHLFVDIASKLSANKEYSIEQNNKAIDAELNVISANKYFICSPFTVTKGEAVFVHTKGGLMTVLAEEDGNGHLTRNLIYSTNTHDQYNDYIYIADKDMNVVICGYNAAGFYIRVGLIYAVQYLNEKLNNLNSTTEKTVNDIDLLERKSNTVEKQVSLGVLNEGAIDTTGNIVSSQHYRYTEPIYFVLKTLVKVTYTGSDIAVISLTDKNASSYTPLLIDNDGDSESTKTQYVNIPSNSYIAICGRKQYTLELIEYNNLSREIDYEILAQIAENNKAIDEELNIVNASSYFYTEPIPIKRGEMVLVHTRGGLNTVIAKAENDGTLIESLVYNDAIDGEVYRDFYYTASTDMYIVVCGKYTSGTYIKVGVKVALSSFETDVNKIIEPLRKFHSGIYIYPFRAIVGKRYIFYKDSIASGLKPSQSYQVDCVDGDGMENYTWNTLSYLPNAAGEQNINVQVSDVFNGKINKTIKVTSSVMPVAKLQNSEPIDVFWMGDSLIGFNGNLIGAEWYRMLATNDAESHIDPVTKAIQLPTLNICPGKINMVGENSWNTRYMYVYSLRVLMRGKRDIPYDPNIGHVYSTSRNPWYNPNSAEPDEIGEDGFNKRVDLPWYFDNACGVGRYPKLFYVAIGVNDIASQGWGYETVPGIVANFVLLCKKIKTECDNIAGGDSGIKIKVLNHQTYPLHNMYHYECDTLQQRLVWNLLYDAYYEAINNPENEISDYVELIDCASRFDWRVGYTQEDIRTNPRYDGEQDIFIDECCHMNNVGAFNYADALIDDFLADSDYD